MVKCVSRAPVAFFDANPHGRVINRFSKDIAVLDVQMTMMSMMFFEVLGQVIVACILTVAVLPVMAAVIVIMVVVILLLKRRIVPITTESLKWDAITRSPINSLFSSSIRGLFTIRAYNQQTFFLDRVL